MQRPSVFTAAELEYLHGQRRLGRVATVGKDGTPHVVPSGWTHNRSTSPAAMSSGRRNSGMSPEAAARPS